MNNVIYLGDFGLMKKQRALASARNLLETENLDNHPDFLLVEPENGVLRVEQVARITEHLSYHVINASCKVVVITDMHKATEEFQNAILKHLEDGSERCTFLLTTETPLLDTIHSRCVVQKCARWDTERMEEWVQTSGLERDEVALALAGGRPGVYSSLFAEQNAFLKEMRTFVKSLNEKGCLEALRSLGAFCETSFCETHTAEQMSLLMEFLQGIFLQMFYHQMESDAKTFGFVKNNEFSVTLLIPIVERCMNERRLMEKKGRYGKQEFYNFCRYLYSVAS